MGTTGRIVVLLAAALVGGVAAEAAETPAPRLPRPAGRVRVYDSTHININTASRTDLMKLDGVSATLAERIIAYRERRGPFRRVADLERVEGVRRALLQRNAGRIVVK